MANAQKVGWLMGGWLMGDRSIWEEKWHLGKSKNNGHSNVLSKKCNLSKNLKAVSGESSNQRASTY
jgi:hypothetical protein